ncbi:protein EVI2B [Python bivittatus]|uniref:Protein EVI2B n=1 Tax=Python bivittatus TaxID=176946 RepID=A0A9F2NGB0_PYTBI|nr:protein EVI2B [Python bivittatus]
MAIKSILLIFIYGQLWWNHTAGKTEGPATVLPPAALVLVGLDSEPHSSSYQASKSKVPTKNEEQMPSNNPQLPITTEEPKGAKFADEHLIVAVIIGVILLFMILIIVAIFLWRQRKRANLPLPHWAGRSPFADGDVPDLTVDKEPAQGIKRMSVLSLLPWKFNKNTQLLENAEDQLSESRQNVDAPQGCGTAGTESESSHTATATLDSSTSIQTQISEEPNNLTDILVQPESPGLVDPPSSSWPSGVSGDICTLEPCPLEQNVEFQCSIPPNLSQQNVGEAVLLPPPPEDFLCN